ncbi:hypothetical protein [Streptomyces griseocarneus]|uniref:hypothetical protein n=1 Tax=Streptomyces griseocarneus TaxID=51201 RepID=UPI00167DC7D9|nr:hypothetical protein [Streptomyces griseocarneus]MBZ6475387.1 hypothetical protein [Streptomyces griseocarneus]GHG75004.1 hypothetical protein GCM10018779_52160 [Streptomyces griseocarneus]
MIKRITATVMPAIAATILLTAAPASASTRWSSCDGDACDWGYVDGSYATIWDQSWDRIGAALDVRTYDGGSPRIVTQTHEITEARYSSNVKRARICEWNGSSLSRCGGWKDF